MKPLWYLLLFSGSSHNFSNPASISDASALSSSSKSSIAGWRRVCSRDGGQLCHHQDEATERGGASHRGGASSWRGGRGEDEGWERGEMSWLSAALSLVDTLTSIVCAQVDGGTGEVPSVLQAKKPSAVCHGKDGRNSVSLSSLFLRAETETELIQLLETSLLEIIKNKCHTWFFNVLIFKM